MTAAAVAVGQFALAGMIAVYAWWANDLSNQDTVRTDMSVGRCHRHTPQRANEAREKRSQCHLQPEPANLKSTS